MKSHLLILVGLLALPGCSLFGEERTQWHIAEAWAHSVELIHVASGQVHFSFEGATPSPCYEYFAHEADVDAQRILVRVHARSTSDYCIAVLGAIEVEPLIVFVPIPGRYTFAFWRGDDPPLEIEVDVP